MHDKYKKRFRVPPVDARVRLQIAREAARRLMSAMAPAEGQTGLREVDEAAYYAAKRKAAAVLGHAVRPGDLPADAEVREQVIELIREGAEALDDDSPEPETLLMSDHVDRFAIYKMRLEPLAAVKQNPKWHPEGDALYHSLQVFEAARNERPYDEEFLLAALLHDVGKAIRPADHVNAALEALRGTLTPRTEWLIAHHMDLLVRPDRPTNPKIRQGLEQSEFFEDLVRLRDLDEGGREPGVPVGTIDEALAYVKGLEIEAYLEPGPQPAEDLPR